MPANQRERRLIGGHFVRPGENFHNQPASPFRHPLGETTEDPVTRSIRRSMRRELEGAIQTTRPEGLQQPSGSDPALFGVEEQRLEAECRDLKVQLNVLVDRLEQTHFKDSAAFYEAGQARKKLFSIQKKLKLADLERSPEQKYARRLAREGRHHASKSAKQKYVDGHYTSQYNSSFINHPPTKASGPLSSKAHPNVSTDVTKWTGNVLNKYWLYEADTANRQGFLKFTGDKVWAEIPGLGASL
jgi:hypothetical protein